MVKIKGYSDRSNYLGITFSCSMFLNNMKHQTTPSEPQFGRNGKIQYSLGQLLDSSVSALHLLHSHSVQKGNRDKKQMEAAANRTWKLRLQVKGTTGVPRNAQQCPGHERHKQQVQAAAFTAGNVWVPVVGLPTSHRTLQSNSKGHQTLLPEPL